MSFEAQLHISVLKSMDQVVTRRRGTLLPPTVGYEYWNCSSASSRNMERHLSFFVFTECASNWNMAVNILRLYLTS
jgi:hypothetical protein